MPGVSQAFLQGAPPREVTVWLDPQRCAELGVRPGEVTQALARSVQHIHFLGGVEEGNQRYSVMLDGRPGGVVSLGEIRIDPNRPILLRHVADIEMGAARRDNVFRINGQPALGVFLFQEEGANVVALGRAVSVITAARVTSTGSPPGWLARNSTALPSPASTRPRRRGPGPELRFGCRGRANADHTSISPMPTPV